MSHRQILIMVILVGSATVALLSYFAYGLYKNTAVQPASQIVPVFSPKAASPPPTEPIYGLPVRLQIPKIKVDATVMYLGLTKAGDMAAPSNIVDVGWYKYGPNPGNTGSAVIDGHIDGLRGEPGVFFDLNKLQPGDSVLIVDNRGQTASFVIRESQTYDQSQQPSEVFNSSNGAHLNLITCTGAWDATQRHFLERLVVFADKSS